MDAQIQQKIEEQIKFYRGTLLDILEIIIEEDKWPPVRKAVLKALGDSGLEGAISRLKI